MVCIPTFEAPKISTLSFSPTFATSGLTTQNIPAQQTRAYSILSVPLSTLASSDIRYDSLEALPDDASSYQFVLGNSTVPDRPVDLTRTTSTTSSAISQLAPEDRNEIEWNYWASRALAMTGNSDLAFEGFRKVAESNSWYGFLAADYLGIAYNLAPKTKRPPETLIANVNERTDVTVARLLFEEGLTVMARRQWDFVTGRLDEEEQKAAAKRGGGQS